MTRDFFLLPLLSFALCAIGMLCAVWLFPRIGLLDFPERYGLKRPRLPYPTGIVALLTFVGFFVSLSPWNLQAKGLVIGVLLLGVLSFLDDRRPLSPLLRLFVQGLVGILLFATGTRIYSLSSPLGSLPSEVLNLDMIHLSVPF